MRRGGALVFAATAAWQGSNFAFNMVAARRLGPAGYGALAAVVALLYVASPVLLCVQTVACRLTTARVARGGPGAARAVLRAGVRPMLAAGTLLGAAVAALAGPLAAFLHVGDAAAIVLLGALLALAGVVHLQRGVLQGTLRLGALAASTLAESSVKVLGAAALLLWLWRSVEAALAATVVAAAVALALNAALLRALPRGAAGSRPAGGVARYSAGALACFLLLAVLASADVVAAKHYLPAAAAGAYASVSLAGKIAFFATSALGTVVFPLFSARQERGEDARGDLLRALAVALGVGGGVVAVAFAAPSLIVVPLFGARYAAAGAHLGPMAAAFAAYGAIYLAAMYLLAHGRHAVLGVLGATVLMQAAMLSVGHGSIAQVVAVEVAVMAAGAVALTALALQPRPAPAVAVSAT